MTKFRVYIMVTLIVFLFSFSTQIIHADEESPGFVEGIKERVEDYFSLDDLRMIDRILESFDDLRESTKESVEGIQESIDEALDSVFFWRDSNDRSGDSQVDANIGKIEGRILDAERRGEEGVRVIAGSYSTYTSGEGNFYFADMPFGDYEVSYQFDGVGTIHEVTTVSISKNTPSIYLQVVLPDETQESQVTVREQPPEEEESLIDEITESDDGTMGNEDYAGRLLLWGILLLILLTPIVIFFRVNRKQIRIIDLSNAEELGKLRLKGKKLIWTDLSDFIINSGGEGIRVQFILPNTKKILGKKLIFTNEEVVLKTIEIYTGEHKFVIEPSSSEENADTSDV